MGTVFYSLMGEGRGHAARARAMTEQLRQKHRVVIYTSFEAFDFLHNIYGNSPVQVLDDDCGQILGVNDNFNLDPLFGSVDCQPKARSLVVTRTSVATGTACLGKYAVGTGIETSLSEDRR